MSLKPANLPTSDHEWTNETEAAAAPSDLRGADSRKRGRLLSVVTWRGKQAFDGYRVIVRNLRTDSTITTSVRGDYFAAATADLARRSVVQAGDVIEVHVIGPDRKC